MISNPVCPPIPKYTPEQLNAAVQEMISAPPDSVIMDKFMPDYAMLRAEIKAVCKR